MSLQSCQPWASHGYFFYSFKPFFKPDVLHFLGIGADGLTVFCTILQKCVKKNISSYCHLVKELKGMSITKEEGASVEKFNQKMHDCIKCINGANDCPTNLAYLILKNFKGILVDIFSHQVNQIFLALARDNNAHNDEMFLPEQESLYESLSGEWVHFAYKKITQTDFAKYQQITNKNMNSLNLKSDKNG